MVGGLRLYSRVGEEFLTPCEVSMYRDHRGCRVQTEYLFDTFRSFDGEKNKERGGSLISGDFHH